VILAEKPVEDDHSCSYHDRGWTGDLDIRVLVAQIVVAYQRVDEPSPRLSPEGPRADAGEAARRSNVSLVNSVITPLWRISWY